MSDIWPVHQDRDLRVRAFFSACSDPSETSRALVRGLLVAYLLQVANISANSTG